MEEAINDKKVTIDNGNGGDKNKFGTFKGVFTPSILTILGVIMYLRMGWVVGSVGIFGTIVIVTLSTAITFFTALSISSSATNMNVGGGGAYFIISRSLGLEAGAAIGIPLFLAQALGISFYISGFSESILSFFPGIPMWQISLFSLVILTLLAYASADLALKAQFLVMTIIIISLVCFFIGGFSDEKIVQVADTFTGEKATFWQVFAVFFPAVTGIEAGLAMSGELKSSARSLPRGTLAAVVIGYIMYIAIPIILFSKASRDTLLADPMIMTKISVYGFIIYIGIWGATLSSALGALLGAPRTLQALAKDKVVPKILGKTYGEQDSPRIATIFTFLVALVGVILGDLNAIAPIISMFFLTSYGMLNITCLFEDIIANPSWRPKFKVKWYFSFLGAFGCFATMFMIDAGATFIAIFLILVVYYLMQRRNFRAQWGDMRRGILMFLARYSIYSLSETKPDAKSWRPNFLVLSGAPTSRWYLVELAHSISHGKGFITVCSIISRSNQDFDHERISALEDSIREYCKKRSVPALVEVIQADSVEDGIGSVVKSYGIGTLTPNTVILGETEKKDNYLSFATRLKFINKEGKNTVIIREGDNVPDEAKKKKKKKRIDVWWGGERQNAGLMLALSYMLQRSDEWSGAELNLITIVKSEAEKISAEKSLSRFSAEGRLELRIEILIVEEWGKNLSSTIQEYSKDCSIVFIGMKPPESETDEEYAAYYKKVIQFTDTLPLTAIVTAAHEIQFTSIFE